MPNEKLINLLLNILNFRVDHVGTEIGGAILTGLSQEEWNSLLSLANAQGISPLLFHRLKKRGLQSAVPPEIWQKLNQRYLSNIARNLRLYAELDQIVQWLSAEQIPVIPLKGIYLAQVVYQNIGLRAMGDLDLLVPETQAQRSWELLKQHGYHAEADPIVCSHLQPLRKEGSAPVEIHWGFYKFGSDFSMVAEEIWKRANLIQLGKTNLLAMSAEDLLLHVCEHLSYGHFFSFGLRPIYDIVLIIEHFGNHLDWEKVYERAESWGLRRGLYLSLLLAQQIGDACLPKTVLKRLGQHQDEATIQVMMEIAKTQLFEDSDTKGSLPPKVASIWNANSLKEKIRIFLDGVAIPQELMLIMHPFALSSPKRYWYHFIRLLHVLRNHAPTVWRLLLGDRTLTAAAQRESLLLNWLNGESG
ncbi:conserved hypothetical protein [Gammaproteobacteria bacterium]